LDQIKEDVFLGEQIVDLFTQDQKIDLRDASTPTKNADLTITVKSPDAAYSVNGDTSRSGVYRAVYSYHNPAERLQNIKNKTESIVAAYLGGLSGLNEALTKRGLDLMAFLATTNGLGASLADTLGVWGAEPLRIIIGDLIVSKEIVEARELPQKYQRELEATKYKIQTNALLTMGLLIEMVAQANGQKPEDIQKEIAASPEKKEEYRKIAIDLVRRQMANNKVFIDIPNGTSFEGVAAILSGLLGGNPGGSKGRDSENNEGGGKGSRFSQSEIEATMNQIGKRHQQRNR
jgi:hypothetical protein